MHPPPRPTRGLKIATLAFAIAAALPVLRDQSLRWGATDEELWKALPGDGLVPLPQLVSTRAITIDAPPEAVWPWIVQIGQGRGGFYSYDLLENLAGCNIHSARSIVPEWQHLEVGDVVRLHEQVALDVAVVEPGRAFVLQGGVPMGGTPPPYDFSWAFVLRRSPDGSTRLVVRERYGYTQSWTGLLVEPVEMVSFLMSTRMLRGVKQRAERAAVPA